MTQYVRRSPYQDAGMRTETIAKQAATFITNTPVETLACNTASPAFSGPDASSVTPIKPTNCCVSRDNLYTAPYMVKPCCEIPYDAPAAYLSPCKVTCYQATPKRQREVATLQGNIKNSDCCTPACTGTTVQTGTSPDIDIWFARIYATAIGSGIQERGVVWS